MKPLDNNVINNNAYIKPLGGAAAVSGVRKDLPFGTQGTEENTEEVNQKKRLGIIECQTCANRTYVDGSDDPGVSFKTPTKLSPNEAASAVPAHEREHYNREAASAESEGKEVLSNSIRIFSSVCEECGKVYVSGGLTTTVTRDREKPAGIEQLLGIDKKSEKDPNSVKAIGNNIANKAYGLNFDTRG